MFTFLTVLYYSTTQNKINQLWRKVEDLAVMGEVQTSKPTQRIDWWKTASPFHFQHFFLPILLWRPPKSSSEKGLCCPKVVLLDTLLHVNGNWNRKWTRPSWVVLYSLLWWSEQFWRHFSWIFILNTFFGYLFCIVVFIQYLCRLCVVWSKDYANYTLHNDANNQSKLPTAVVKMLTSDWKRMHYLKLTLPMLPIFAYNLAFFLL